MLMRIAFLNPQGNFDPNDRYWAEHPDFGGQLVYVKEAAMQVAKQGIFTDILTRRISDPGWLGFEREIEKYPDCDKCTIVRLRFGGDCFLNKERLWPYIVDYARAVIAYYRKIGEFPDVFTGHYADGGLAAAIIARETGRPFTFTAHSLGAQKIDKLGISKSNFLAMEKKYHFSRRIEAEKIAMKYARKCIGSSDEEWDKQYSHRLYRDTIDGKHNFVTIAPGVNTEIFTRHKQTGDDERFRKFSEIIIRDISPHRKHLPLVLCASRPDPKKNQIGLLNAFSVSTSLKNSANAAFVFRGISDPLAKNSHKPPMLTKLLAFIHANGLEGAVVFFDIESQQALASLYRFCAKNRGIFTLLAFYEPFGLAPLEAMICGLPAVVTENGGPREVLAEGEHGVLIPPDNPQEISQGILQLLENKKTWQAYREKGMRRVYSDYTWQKCAENYIALCREIAGEKNKEIVITPWFLNPLKNDDSLVKNYFVNTHFS